MLAGKSHSIGERITGNTTHIIRQLPQNNQETLDRPPSPPYHCLLTHSCIFVCIVVFDFVCFMLQNVIV